MKRLSIAAVAVLAMNGAPLAGPWEYQSDDYGHEAWQASNDGDYALSFVCDDTYGDNGIFRIAGPERYEKTTSYADKVPTTFTVDGKSLEISGVFTAGNELITEDFEDHMGTIGVLYAYTNESGPKLTQLFDMIVAAKGDIRVRFFDKDLAFSLEDAAVVLEQVAAAADVCHDPML